VGEPRAVVVGGGPCGVSLALWLARAGWAVALMEATPAGAARPYRGEGLMPSGVEALAAMGLWPLPPGVPHRRLEGWAMVVERRPLFDAAEPLGGDRGCWLVDQDALLAELRGELAALGGVELLEGCAVREVLTAQGASARVRGVLLADGRRRLADLVVGCDGRHSLLRQRGDLPLEAEPAGEEVLWFRLAGPAVRPLERWLGGRFLTVVGPGLSFALFQEAAGAALRLGWVAESGVERPDDPAGWRAIWSGALPEEGAECLRRVPVAAISGPQRFPVRVGWAPRWHRPGLLVLGDAAHPMSPVRAQGLNMALRDALVAGRLLAPLAAGATTEPSSVTGADGRPPAEGEQAEGEMAEAERAGRIDAVLPRIAARRLPEIRLVQELQAREAGLGALLRQRDGLRQLLAATLPWSGWVARRGWIQRQHRLRQGRPDALELPE
jgi:2-polyprenyl-6-methoxyphenol hydroxylase-like FAD-dependent oxidoreductase